MFVPSLQCSGLWKVRHTGEPAQTSGFPVAPELRSIRYAACEDLLPSPGQVRDYPQNYQVDESWPVLLVKSWFVRVKRDLFGWFKASNTRSVKVAILIGN